MIGEEMITIGREQKTLLFDISTEGIDFNNLEFWLRIYNEDIVFSFRGQLLEENKQVKVVIPPIPKMINKEYINLDNEYKVILEVIGENKYFINTWEGEIRFESTPSVSIKLISENNSDNIKGDISIQNDTKKNIIKKDDIISGKKNEKENDIVESMVNDRKNKIKKYSSSLLEDILNNVEESANVLDELI